MRGQKAGRRLADMADAKREDQPMQRDTAAGFDSCEKIFRRFRPPPFAVLQPLQTGAVAGAQVENVGGLADPAVAIQRLDLLGAQPLDVEGRA